ncbi:MAG TPA: hypothetical protein PKA10_14770 [Selenomonadales bacterium]|nr:hypothetical protein [Selenomonadales bacterium]
MQALWDGVISGYGVAKPFLAAILLVGLLVLVGDRGTRIALRRNNPCLATLCIFIFSLGTGFVTWFLVMQPLFALFGATFALSYPLVMMYWAFWLLVGVLISAKKLIYESGKRQGQLP